VLDKAVILLLKLLLGCQFLFPGVFQRAGYEPMLRFDRLVLTSSPLDFIGGSFSPLLPEPIQLGALLLQTRGGGERPTGYATRYQQANSEAESGFWGRRGHGVAY
jgi:hypothetical protein